MDSLSNKDKKNKVAFLSMVAFDANVSLINALKSYCDIYFVSEACHEKFNHLKRDELQKFMNSGKDVSQIQKFSDLIPLDKTYIVKGCQQRFFLKKIFNSFRIHDLIRKINPDVIIIDGPGLTYLVSSLLYRSKTLLLVHDPFLHSGGEFFIDMILRKIFFKLIKKKVLLNETQKNDFIEFYNQKQEDVYVSFLGLYKYLKCFGQSKQNKDNIINKEFFNILFFGGISEYKGIKYLLDAFFLIPKSLQSKMRLTIAGKGQFDFEAYKSIDIITIINDFVQPEELSQIISSADIIICPYTDATQSGVVMSGYAFHKPIIATNVGGLPEMVFDGKTGIIIEPKDAQAIADAIVHLYSNPNIINLYKNGIIEIYEKGSKSWDNAAKLFMIAINDVIKENS